jgi:hypothetical protein
MECLNECLGVPANQEDGDKYRADGGVPQQNMMGGAGMMGMMSGMLGNPELMAMLGAGQAPQAPDPNGCRETFGSKAAQVVPADVIMFSGCKDSQTSADVHNVSPIKTQFAGRRHIETRELCIGFQMIRCAGRSPRLVFHQTLGQAARAAHARTR